MHLNKESDINVVLGLEDKFRRMKMSEFETEKEKDEFDVVLIK